MTEEDRGMELARDIYTLITTHYKDISPPALMSALVTIVSMVAKHYNFSPEMILEALKIGEDAYGN